jgi:hypothetical protein
LHNLSPQAQDSVTERELRGPQQLGIRFTGHEARELQSLAVKGLVELLVQALGFGFLLGRQGDLRHGTPPRGMKDKHCGPV